MAAREDDLKAKMLRALDGDGVAYRALLQLLVPRLRNFFGRRVPADAVEDLVQETLMALHTRRGTFDRGRPFSPWLFAIARHKVVDHFRSNRHVSLMDELDTQFAAPDLESANGAAIDVERLLDTLPPKQRDAILATKIEGLTMAEAAAASGISTSDAKVSVHRGLKRLSARVEREV